MKVESFETRQGERYLLIDEMGNLVYPVAKFLKYKDNTAQGLEGAKYGWTNWCGQLEKGLEQYRIWY